MAYRLLDRPAVGGGGLGASWLVVLDATRGIRGRGLKGLVGEPSEETVGKHRDCGILEM